MLAFQADGVSSLFETLLRQRLYGTKIGFVWAIYPDDLEAFKRMRRPPGRPRKQPMPLARKRSKNDLVGRLKRR